MPSIESGVLNIRSVINLVTPMNNSRWSIPGFLNVNTRSLSIETLDELLVVARTNNVACVNVTETWFKRYVDWESVGLASFCSERTDRVEREGGGVLTYNFNI